MVLTPLYVIVYCPENGHFLLKGQIVNIMKYFTPPQEREVYVKLCFVDYFGLCFSLP